MPVNHTLPYKCGSLVHIRHDDAGKECGFLPICALSRGMLSYQPYIYGVNGHTCGNANVGEENTPINLLTNNPIPQ